MGCHPRERSTTRRLKISQSISEIQIPGGLHRTSPRVIFSATTDSLANVNSTKEPPDKVVGGQTSLISEVPSSTYEMSR